MLTCDPTLLEEYMPLLIYLELLGEFYLFCAMISYSNLYAISETLITLIHTWQLHFQLFATRQFFNAGLDDGNNMGTNFPALIGL